MRCGHGPHVAVDGAAHVSAGRCDVRHALAGDAFRLCLLQPSGWRVPWRAHRRHRFRADRLLRPRLVAFGTVWRAFGGDQPADCGEAGGASGNGAGLRQLSASQNSHARACPGHAAHKFFSNVNALCSIGLAFRCDPGTGAASATARVSARYYTDGRRFMLSVFLLSADASTHRPVMSEGTIKSYFNRLLVRVSALPPKADMCGAIAD